MVVANIGVGGVAQRVGHSQGVPGEHETHHLAYAAAASLPVGAINPGRPRRHGVDDGDYIARDLKGSGSTYCSTNGANTSTIAFCRASASGMPHFPARQPASAVIRAIFIAVPRAPRSLGTCDRTVVRCLDLLYVAAASGFACGWVDAGCVGQAAACPAVWVQASPYSTGVRIPRRR